MPLDAIVSMNFWGFAPDVFIIADDLFKTFLVNHKNSETAEFYIPQVVDYMINENKGTFKMLETNTNWFGVTYKEDELMVKKQLHKLISEEVYPIKLW
jgi:dTDP-glucose pyrophosphorylase